VNHSYWFNSAQYNGSATGRVCAAIANPAPGGSSRCNDNFVRLCLVGQGYHNCHDEDGFGAQARVTNESANAHTIEGHGAY
jgi:hypothetical protein